MSEESLLEAQAEDPDVLNNMFRRLQSKFKVPEKTARIQRERKGAAGAERADGRSLRNGAERDDQLNVGVRRDLKERLKLLLKSRRQKITDWLEQKILEELEGKG